MDAGVRLGMKGGEVGLSYLSLFTSLDGGGVPVASSFHLLISAMPAMLTLYYSLALLPSD